MLQAESSRGAVGGFQPLKLMKVCVYVCVYGGPLVTPNLRRALLMQTQMELVRQQHLLNSAPMGGRSRKNSILVTKLWGLSLHLVSLQISAATTAIR